MLVVARRVLVPWIAVAIASALIGAAVVAPRDGGGRATVQTFRGSIDSETTTTTAASLPSPATTVAPPTTTGVLPTPTRSGRVSPPTTPSTTTTPGEPGLAMLDGTGMFVGPVSGDAVSRLGAVPQLAPCFAPNGLSWRPDGRSVGLFGGDTAWEFPVAGGAPDAVGQQFDTTRGDSGDVAVAMVVGQTANGTRSYIQFTGADLRSHPVRVELAGNQGEAFAPRVSADGSTVAVFGDAPWSFALYSASGRLVQDWKPVATTDQGMNTAMGWTTDGQWLVYLTAGQLFAMHPDGSASHSLGVKADPREGVFAPGSQIFGPGSQVLAHQEDVRPGGPVLDRMILIDVSSGKTTQVGDIDATSVAWSRHGGPIIWSGFQPDQVSGIFALTPGGESRKIANEGQVVVHEGSASFKEYISAHQLAVSSDGTHYAACQ